MNKFIILFILVIIAVLVSSNPSKPPMNRNIGLNKYKSYNLKRFNKIESPNISVNITDNSRDKLKNVNITGNNMIIDPRISSNADKYVENRYKNILKEWNGIIKN